MEKNQIVSELEPLLYKERCWSLVTGHWSLVTEMTHPLVPAVLDLSVPIVEQMGLQVVGAVFHTHQSPPVLRVDVLNPARHTSLEDCESVSRALDAALDAADLIDGAYVLEVSSPGISRQLGDDREFVAFRGFDVRVTTREPFKGSIEWNGQLRGRDETAVHLNLKGRAIAIPRELVTTVELET